MINEQKDIIQRCIAGDRAAQKALYLRHADRMLNVAYRICNNREDARDILQESFVKAFRNLAQFKFQSSFQAWLKRIVINSAINFVKKKGIKIVGNLDTVSQWYSEDQEDSDDFQDVNIEVARKALMQLPNGYRTVLSLYLIEGYDHSEIAEILGIAKSTSLTQFKRGKEKLKILLLNKSQNAKY